MSHRPFKEIFDLRVVIIFVYACVYEKLNKKHIIILQVPSSPTNIVGYVLAFRRSDLDLNYSSVTLIGASVSSHVIALSRASQRYDIKISAFTSMEFGDFSDPITWCSSGKSLCYRAILYE